MIFHINKGRHRARPFRFGIWWNRKAFARKVVFANNCRYELPGDDQLDTNKIFGVGYLAWPRIMYKKRWWTFNRTLVPMHRIYSARFGWRYLPQSGKMELLAYCYDKGKRIVEGVAPCDVGQLYRLHLNITANEYRFTVIDSHGKILGQTIIAKRHGKKLQYRLGLFFGGNRTAPQQMTILIEKV
jgi:hypothetical protein